MQCVKCAEQREKMRVKKKLFEERMAGIFPDLSRDINLPPKHSSRINTMNFIPRNNMTALLKVQDNQ